MLLLRNINQSTNRCKFWRFLGKMSTMEHKINIKGQTINYVKVGEGSKNVLCFPGALGSIWSDFKPQIEGLDKNKFTVVVWDPPGYGYSRPPEKKFDYKFYETDADMAYEFMKTIGINRFSLLGWSNGGVSSMILAATYPETVDKLVIWGSHSYILPEEAEMFKKLRNINTWSEEMKSPLIALYTEKGLQDMLKSWTDILLQRFENGGDICKSYLASIKCPTLILHGDKDPMVTDEQPKYLLENIKMSVLHRFPKGKHNIHLRYAEEFNDLVSKFLLS